MARRTQFRLLVAFTIVWIAWAGWSLLGRSHPYELRVLDDQGTPVASAVVDIGGSQVGTTGDDGRVDLVWSSSATVLEIGAPGHVPQRLTLNDQPADRFEVVLKARVLRGRVVDEEGTGIEGATVIAGAATGVSDTEGYFQVRGAEEGRVMVERPAWQPATFDWSGQTGETIVQLEPFIARAVHIDGDSMREDFDRFVDMAMDTELNALMIDLKDETGKVWYDTANETAIEVGAAEAAYDLGRVVQRSEELGLYVIGRIVLFNDPIAAANKPEMAVWDSDTNSPYEARGQFFLDPTDPDARQYGLDLAVEACEAGVDEIQFDYVRFPDARRESAIFDGGVNPEVRLATITGLLGSAVETLRPLGCAVAADIFGYLTTAKDDGGIGQRWEDVAAIVDVVSPMLYPSHYDPGWYGFEAPNQFPGELVDLALADGMERLPRQVVVRPWLQDFGYDAAQVRAQIQSAEQYGLGWMLWNAASNVTVEALRPAE
ncbi:MAG TPA: putative glycoside hydrolase [Acidimicrobiia bacterium]|nr:putative glycoside hydrolase [Acidimicrobiia bacterium]